MSRRNVSTDDSVPREPILACPRPVCTPAVPPPPSECSSDGDDDDAVCLDDLFVSEQPAPPGATVSPDPNLPDFMPASDPTTLPSHPTEEWVPDEPVDVWTERTWQAVPAPLRRWIQLHEPTMQVPWSTIMDQNRKSLPALSKFCLVFEPQDRKEAVRWLFDRKKLFHTDQERADFQSLLCGFPEAFGHIQFRLHDDISAFKCILGVADCFLSIVDECGFPPQIIWDPLPRVEDPPNFQAGGVHSARARAHWDKIPGLSKWVRHWIHYKVWFDKPAGQSVNHSAKNAACLCPGHKHFDADKHDFMDKKILNLLAVGAVVPLPDGELPEVLTRLSLAPKPGKGEPWRT